MWSSESQNQNLNNNNNNLRLRVQLSICVDLRADVLKSAQNGLKLEQGPKTEPCGTP